MKRFSVIKGGGQPRSFHLGETQQIVCSVCESDLGYATSLFVEAKQSPMRNGNRVTGGTKLLACLYCLTRGKETLVT